MTLTCVFKLVIQYHLPFICHSSDSYIYWIYLNLIQFATKNGQVEDELMKLPETWLSSFKVWNLKNQQSLFSKAIHAANGIPPSQQRALCLKVWGWGASKTCQLRSVVGVQTIGKCNLIAEMALKRLPFHSLAKGTPWKEISRFEVWCLYSGTWKERWLKSRLAQRKLRTLFSLSHWLRIPWSRAMCFWLLYSEVWTRLGLWCWQYVDI